MTADQLSDLLVANLLREHGGAKHLWRKRIGTVKLYDPATHPHCNWRVDPVGTFSQIAAIEDLVDRLRGQHPILSGR